MVSEKSKRSHSSAARIGNCKFAVQSKVGLLRLAQIFKCTPAGRTVIFLWLVDAEVELGLGHLNWIWTLLSLWFFFQRSICNVYLYLYAPERLIWQKMLIWSCSFSYLFICYVLLSMHLAKLPPVKPLYLEAFSVQTFLTRVFFVFLFVVI